VARQYSHRRTTENLHDCQIVSQMSASHGSRYPLAYVVRTGNQGLAKRLWASPNRPVWSGATDQAPKEGRSREATTRCIKGLENVRSAIFGPSHHSHTPLLDLAFSTNAPVGQTVPRLAVWTVGAIGGHALTASKDHGVRTFRRDPAALSQPRSCVATSWRPKNNRDGVPARPRSEFCHVLLDFMLANHYTVPKIVTVA